MSNYSTWTDEQLDIAIAERVYDIFETNIDGPDVRGYGGYERRFSLHRKRPTLSADAMLDLIEAMRKRGWWCRIESPAGDEETWWARFAHPQGPRSHTRAATPQRAVCIAALMALDAETK